MATSESDIASDSDSVSDSVSPFDPEDYNPSPYEFEPVGLSQYKPKRTAHGKEVVLREPLIHFSVQNGEEKKYIKGFGGSGRVKSFYNQLPERAKQLVDDTGFKGFIQLLGKTSNDCMQLTALAERWWDTTNTFHLPFAEATLTPLDFAAITGIRVGGNPIPFDMKLYRKPDALIYFLGRVPEMKGKGLVRYQWLYKNFKDHQCTTEEDFKHVARAFLLYLFGVALFPNKDGTVHLHYLPAMRDLAMVKDYDWGGAALATLYGHMGAISRGITRSTGGYWRVWEIWSFEFLQMLAPQNDYKNPSVIPRGLKWQRKSKGKREGAKDLVVYRAFLDNLQENQVNWDVWARIDEEATSDLLRSREAAGKRILLEGPFCRQWYLGERVVRQSLGYNTFRVPKPIPRSMLKTTILTVEEIGTHTQGEDAAAFLEETGDYSEYRALRLMPALGFGGVQRDLPRRQWARNVSARTSKGSTIVKWPKLPQRVGYTSSSGHMEYLNLPSPKNGAYPLPASVEQVPRDFAEACLRTISSLEALVRTLAFAGPTAAPLPMRAPMRGRGGRVLAGREGYTIRTAAARVFPMARRNNVASSGDDDDSEMQESNRSEDDEVEDEDSEKEEKDAEVEDEEDEDDDEDADETEEETDTDTQPPTKKNRIQR